jgi:hypothetical protein
MKSFLTNNPDVKLALNEDLVLAKSSEYGASSGMGVGVRPTQCVCNPTSVCVFNPTSEC